MRRHAPPLEPWAKVYVGGSNGDKFFASAHGRIACVQCHGGREPADGKKTAHGTADFVGSPSRKPEKYCAGCHPSYAQRDANSLHTQGFGQKALVALRGGFPSYEAFPEDLKKGYDTFCGKCHASCGECHVIRPRQAGGGFLGGHVFQQPDMRLNCTACHSARIAHAYFGEANGLKPDVHYVKLPGGLCTNCHSVDEMHGDGTKYEQRFQVRDQPRCETCHGDKATANSYHSMHWNKLSCQSCHAQDYQNCGSCHVNAEAVRKGPFMGFKIGINTMPGTFRFKFVVLRNTPAAPDTWSKFGIPVLANFDAAPTFKLATPHNIQRWTPRTQVQSGQACYEACHISNGRNKGVFLFDSDLLDWEKAANRPVVVDGKLPAGWN